ncbi:MAG: hypothetical protein GY940_25675 [bacterium]|nr:hypothetical protein [bacterium]
MVALTISLQELLSFIKQNVKIPPVLEGLNWEGDRLSLEIPQRGEDASPIPIEGVIDFSSQTFNLDFSSGDVQSLASATVGVDGLLHLLQKLIKMPKILENLEYDTEKEEFNLLIQREARASESEPNPPTPKPIHLGAKLISQPNHHLRLRIFYKTDA